MVDEAHSQTVDPELLEILRCPVALKQGGGDAARLRLHASCWLVCDASGMRYPIRNGIPVMLIDEAQTWRNVPLEELPVPPPDGPAAGH